MNTTRIHPYFPMHDTSSFVKKWTEVIGKPVSPFLNFSLHAGLGTYSSILSGSRDAINTLYEHFLNDKANSASASKYFASNPLPGGRIVVDFEPRRHPDSPHDEVRNAFTWAFNLTPQERAILPATTALFYANLARLVSDTSIYWYSIAPFRSAFSHYALIHPGYGHVIRTWNYWDEPQSDSALAKVIMNQRIASGEAALAHSGHDPVLVIEPTTDPNVMAELTRWPHDFAVWVHGKPIETTATFVETFTALLESPK